MFTIVELQLKTQVFTQVCAGTPSGAVLLRAEGGTAIYSYQVSEERRRKYRRKEGRRSVRGVLLFIVL